MLDTQAVNNLKPFQIFMNKRYKIEKSLGRGGMGEVFLAYDTEAKRHVAIKRIRSDLKDNPLVKKRFLREAIISSIISHPFIIPVYDVHLKEPYFYTMPYVEGKTLKEILNTSKIDKNHPIGSSIPTLIRIFLNICEAVAYIHSKNILHRDLKPDNIIIGKYGEILILDWGIATFLNEKEISPKIKLSKSNFDLTRPGKVTGTVTYMSPERALGKKTTALSDIYSLGVILYQVLTLEMPYKRKDIKTFRKNLNLEKILEPIEKSPFRDIPKKLSDICVKCLSKEEKDRYQGVEDLISDIKDYVEGKPQWVLSANLDSKNQDDWQFQENVLLAKHSAISRKTQLGQWITLMVSKQAFSANMKIEADISLDKWSNGIGFFFNILKTNSNFKIEEGYKLWFSTNRKDSEFCRSNVLIHKETLSIQPDAFHHITIENLEDKLNIYVNSELVFSHINHLPVRGDFFGLAFKDASFTVKNLKIYTTSYNVMVNCLAIADAFFAKEDYDAAIKEYQKIAFSFPGRKESHEAIFRAGISYLEKAKKMKKNKDAVKYLEMSLDEFQKLHSTFYEPLEYLGKSLVYLEKQDFIEEAKCLELMVRKFINHHQNPIIKEYLLYRMHQSSLQNRQAAYRTILIALRFIPALFENIGSKKLLDGLQKHSENFYFLERSNNTIHYLSIKLSFILNNTNALLEILHTQNLNDTNVENAIFSLLELNQMQKAENELEKNKDKLKKSSYETLKLAFARPYEKTYLEILSMLKKNSFGFNKSKFFKLSRVLIFLSEKLFHEKKYKQLTDSYCAIKKIAFSEESRILIDSIFIKAFLIENNTKAISRIFDGYSLEKITQDNSPLCFLYGLWLFKTEKKEIADAYFSNLTGCCHPFSFAISSYYLASKNKNFIKRAFHYEKRRLLNDLLLYGTIIKNKKIITLSKKLSV